MTITFNVVFTPGTPARLAPLSLTFLEGAGVSLRLVANACGPEDVEVLRAAADSHERVSCHVVPDSQAIEHGVVLNHLFEAFPQERYFAFADSDVVASGDFMPALWPLAQGQAAVSTAAPVWATEADTIVPPRWPILSGRLNRLADGTPVGTTYMAIYDRAVTEPRWRAAPRGFALHHRRDVPRTMRRALAERGWSFRVLDTCRLVNLRLLMDGFAIENRSSPQLHHVGGLSSMDLVGLGGALRSLPQALRSSEGRRLWRIVDPLAYRVLLAGRTRSPQMRRLNVRRATVRAHARAALDALAAGTAPPPAPHTDSPEVDARLVEMDSALAAAYSPSSRTPRSPHPR